MLSGNPNAFCANPLDRAGVARKNDDWLERQRADSRAKLLILYKGDVLIERTPTAARLQFVTMEALRALPRSRELVLLGLWDDAPIFAADVSSADDPPLADIGEYGNLRSLAQLLPPQELSVAGQARWLLDWHRRNHHCARFGDKTVSAEGGFKRVNTRTGTEHFPRTDPVAIVLPVLGDRVCLGRGPHFPPAFMSAFAGYLEPGETLEQCGERELFEEAGLRTRAMRYLFSQPWPFPSSLMMGFVAEVEDDRLTLDPTEIEEARWFTRDEAAAILGGTHEILCPPPSAIAHQLLKHWLEA